MTGKFSRQWAAALAKVQAKGAPVTFTLQTPGTENIATGARGAPTITTISGYAVRAKGKPLTYQRLSLIESEAPTLEFVPSVYGQQPALSSTCVFGGKPYTVADVDPIAPDGVTILSRVVVST